MDLKPQWDKTVVHNGYILVYCPEHPRAWKRTLIGYVYAHRIVIEISLGRILLSTEHVHHINEDRSDYRVENLQVMSNAAHARFHRLQKPAEVVSLVCPSCQGQFSRSRRKTFLRNKRIKRSFCSRQCIGSFTASHRQWRAKIVPNQLAKTAKVLSG
jgi:hypothetical protein